MTELVKSEEPPAAWQERLLEITRQMRLIMMPFVTPLVRAEPDGAAHVGSGGYLEKTGRRLLLTNHHVVDEGQGRLMHKFLDSEYYFATATFVREPAPMDLAVVWVDHSWQMTSHSAMMFPEHRVARKHNPVRGELLFMMGFARTRAYYSPSLEVMLTNGTPYLTQEFDPGLEEREIRHCKFDPNYHFAVPWEPDKIEAVDRDRNSIPIDPHGFSGSFVWNTRFMEYSEAGKEWEPGVAQLTGIVWGWPTNSRVLFATRIEFVTTFLARALEAGLI
jgi:hypothetical protein